MIIAITLHLLIGLGGLACGTCGRKFCRGRMMLVLVTGIFLLAEACASVLIIDRMGLE
jgi:hypothetical protein